MKGKTVVGKAYDTVWLGFGLGCKVQMNWLETGGA